MADYNKLSEALRRIVQAPENNLMILHGFVAKYTSGNKGAVGTIDFISMDGTVRIPEIPINGIMGRRYRKRLYIILLSYRHLQHYLNQRGKYRRYQRNTGR